MSTTAKAQRGSTALADSNIQLRGSWETVFQKPADVPTKPATRQRSKKRTTKAKSAAIKSTPSAPNSIDQQTSDDLSNGNEKSHFSEQPGNVIESVSSDKFDDIKPDLSVKNKIDTDVKTIGKTDSHRKELIMPLKTTKRGAVRRSKSEAPHRSTAARRASSIPEAAEDKSMHPRQITDYFPVVRRSDRRTSKLIEAERQETLEFQIDAFKTRESTCFKVVQFDDKGRGVIAATKFDRGDFVVEYAGELISETEAGRREEAYARDESVGCYVYHFLMGNTRYCIDATRETDRIGRLINHSRKEANLVTRCMTIPQGAIRGSPRLLFFAKRDISVGEELLYDYGDRSRSALESHPWLKT